MEGLVLPVSKFILLEEFIEKHDVNLNVLYVNKGKNFYPDAVFLKQAKRKMLIDENFFIKRCVFKKKVWNESHDFYFFLTRHISNLQLARLLYKIDKKHSVHSWNNFLAVTLFGLRREDILSYKVEGLTMKFYRYSRWLIRALFVKVGIPLEKRDIKVLLNRY